MNSLNESGPVQRSLVKSTHDLMTLVNRLNLLQREEVKVERKNHITMNKTLKILEAKRYQQRIREQLSEQQKSEQVRLSKLQQQSLAIKEKIMKSQELLKNGKLDQSGQKQIQVKEERLRRQRIIEERIIKIQEQAQQNFWIQKQKQIRSRQGVSIFWQRKLQGYQSTKQLENQIQAKQSLLQDEQFGKLEKIEVKMIDKLHDSQQLTQALNKQLEDAMTLSQGKFYQIYPQKNFQPKPYKLRNQQNQMQSRYITSVNYNNNTQQISKSVSLPQIGNFKKSDQGKKSSQDDQIFYETFKQSQIQIKKVYSNQFALKIYMPNVKMFQQKAQTDRQVYKYSLKNAAGEAVKNDDYIITDNDNDMDDVERKEFKFDQDEGLSKENKEKTFEDNDEKDRTFEDNDEMDRLESEQIGEAPEEDDHKSTNNNQEEDLQMKQPTDEPQDDHNEVNDQLDRQEEGEEGQEKQASLNDSQKQDDDQND